MNTIKSKSLYALAAKEYGSRMIKETTTDIKKDCEDIKKSGFVKIVAKKHLTDYIRSKLSKDTISYDEMEKRISNECEIVNPKTNKIEIMYGGSSHVVHTGARGGKYIVVGKDKRKIYLKK